MANLAPARTTSAFSLGQTKIRATISRSAPPAASCTTPATVRTSAGDNQLMIAPSASRPARRNIPSRRAAIRIGGVTSGRMPSRKPLISNVSNFCADLLAAERGTQEADHVAHLLVRLDERHAVPALDDHVARRADADGEATRRGVGQRGHGLRQARRRARVRRHDGRAEAQARLPRRGQGERGEGIGAVGLRRPDVGVPEVGDLGVPLAVRVQRTGQRHGHPWAGGQVHVSGSSRRSGPFQYRTMQL